MNFIDKFLLKLFLLAAPLLQKIHVDLNHLKAILIAKLTMDNRRPAAFQQMQRSKEKKEINSATLGTMLISFIMGLFFLFSLMIGDDLTTKLTVFFSMFIFMLAATLITDFTSVLIDTRDNLIILPKPINDATFVTARLLHIAIHINKLILPLAFPSLIALIFIGGIATIIPFLFMLLFASLLSIFLINAVYIIILKIVKPSKFQSVISYFQIAFAIFIYGGYQLLPRMMEKAGMENMNISLIKNIHFYPPFWFADTCVSLSTWTFSFGSMLSILLSIGIPALSIYMVIKYFAPSFNRQLSMITSRVAEISKSDTNNADVSAAKAPWVNKIARWLTKEHHELMGFLFTWKMMSRSRDFKMKVYPAFGYVLVMIVIMVFRSKSFSISDVSDLTSEGKTFFILCIYICSLLPISAINQIAYSDKFKASWIFAMSPIEIPGRVISGAIKSVFLKFYIPLVLIFAIPGIFLAGPVIIPNLILGCFNILFTSSMIAYINLRNIPFTTPIENASKGKTFSQGMLSLVIPAALGACHWFLFDFIWAVILLAILSVIATWMVFDSIRNLTWAKVKGFDSTLF